MQFKTLAVSLIGLMWTIPALAETVTFIPTKGVEATLVLEGSILNVAVKSEMHSESRTIEFEAENALHVQVDDFNFDGAKDFSVWQLDDGMGTYDYYRVFVYQPQTGVFKELQPDCGDGFVNLRVDKKRKVLLSTYWGMNGPDQCITRFTRRKT
ncbi:XAC2610-related protein [Pseudomonas sp. TWP3-2]|uniref:XAC2610-related protein n=1 Tax=Pseudomonas sp. TWP3-2 TaxID=2804574 RepID=UPI003CF60D14